MYRLNEDSTDFGKLLEGCQQADVFAAVLKALSAVFPDTDQAWCMREVDDIVDNVGRASHGMEQRCVLKTLSEYLFIQKKWKCIEGPKIRDFSIGKLLKSGEGSSSLIALLYLHLADKLGVSLGAVPLEDWVILKTEIDDDELYVDVAAHGSILGLERCRRLIECQLQRPLESSKQDFQRVPAIDLVERVFARVYRLLVDAELTAQSTAILEFLSHLNPEWIRELGMTLVKKNKLDLGSKLLIQYMEHSNDSNDNFYLASLMEAATIRHLTYN